MPVPVPATPPPTELETALAEAAAGERVVYERNGQRLAVVGPEDLARLEAEDEEDAALAVIAREAHAEWAADDYRTIPMAEVLRRYGLE